MSYVLLDCTTKLCRTWDDLNRISELFLLLQFLFITKVFCWDPTSQTSEASENVASDFFGVDLHLH